MKRLLTALAVVSWAVFVTIGCNDYGNTFQIYTGATLAFLSPSTIQACVPAAAAPCPDLTLLVNGTGFVPQTVVLWNGGKLKTTVTTDTNGNVTSVTANVPASLLTKPGSAMVQTLNPFSGAGNNGLSNPIAFLIKPIPNPVPAISGMSPTSATAGSAALALTITGTNFLLTSDPTGGSQVRWNTTTQTNLAVGSLTSTSITATVPASLLATVGTATVTVYNLPAQDPTCTINCSSGGGGSSNGVTFTITGAGGTAATVSTAQVEEETPAVSQDGRYVAYTALQNGHYQVFVRDTCQGADSCQSHTILLSVAQDGSAGNDDSHSPSISSDGRYLGFSSAATNLVANAPKGRQVYLRDTCLGASAGCAPSTELISTDPNGTLVGTENILPSVSASGRFVAFLSVALSHNADSSATNNSTSSTPNSGYRQVFVRDTCHSLANCTPTTTRISLQPSDGSETGAKPAGPAISGNSNHVAIAGGTAAMLFTRSVPVDDGVFLAITKKNQ